MVGTRGTQTEFGPSFEKFGPSFSKVWSEFSSVSRFRGFFHKIVHLTNGVSTDLNVDAFPDSHDFRRQPAALPRSNQTSAFGPSFLGGTDFAPSF